MNVSKIQNNQTTFNGNLLVKNIKTGTIEKFITDAKADKEIADSFEKVVNNRLFVLPNSEDCLAKLKKCIDSLFDAAKIKPENKLEYPKAKDVNINYISNKNKSEIDVPGYFSITHSA